MKIIEPGHVYEFHTLDKKEGDKDSRIVFVNREPGSEHCGTQTQEVLRALIDRTLHCDHCLPWVGNDEIIHHLRQALVLHEMRALQRKAAKGIYKAEQVETFLEEPIIKHYLTGSCQCDPDVGYKCEQCSFESAIRILRRTLPETCLQTENPAFSSKI